MQEHRSAPLYFVVLLSVLANAALRGSKVLVSLDAIELGASAFTIGVIAALFAVFPLLLAVQAGRISDRIGVRRPILLGAICMSAGLALPAVFGGLAALFLCPTLIGLGHVFLHVSTHNAIGSIGDRDERARNFSVFSLGSSIAAFIGPSLAGVSIDTIGYQPAYLALAGCTVFAAILVALFPRAMPDRAGDHEAPQGTSTLDLLRDSALRRTLIMSGVTLTGIELFTFYLPIYGRSVGLSASSIGLVLSAYAAAGFAVRLAMQRLARRYTELGVLTGSLFIAAAAYGLIPFLSQLPLLVLLAFLLGLGLGSAQPLTIMLTYDHAPKGRSGEALGMRVTVNKVTQIAVPLLFGGLGSAFGVPPVFWANAAFLLLGGVISVRDLRAGSRKRESAPSSIDEAVKEDTK
jgi:predicted MFS family arabinose efflux permease